MSCITLNIELTDVNFVKALRIFINVTFKDPILVLQKKVKSHKTSIWMYWKFHAVVQKSGSYDYSELPNILQKDIKADRFEKMTEN